METMLSFINLFLVPFVSVSIYSRRHKETVTLSGTWLVRYAVLSVCNVPVSFAGIYAVRFFLHREVFKESARYWLWRCALRSCFLTYVTSSTWYSHMWDSRLRDGMAGRKYRWQDKWRRDAAVCLISL